MQGEPGKQHHFLILLTGDCHFLTPCLRTQSEPAWFDRCTWAFITLAFHCQTSQTPRFPSLVLWPGAVPSCCGLLVWVIRLAETTALTTVEIGCEWIYCVYSMACQRSKVGENQYPVLLRVGMKGEQYLLKNTKGLWLLLLQQKHYTCPIL